MATDLTNYYILHPTLPPDNFFDIPKDMPKSIEDYMECLHDQLQKFHDEAYRNLQGAKLQNKH